MGVRTAPRLTTLEDHVSLPHPGSVADQHGRPLDQVRLTGIRAKGYHGVLDHERAEGQVGKRKAEDGGQAEPAGA